MKVKMVTMKTMIVTTIWKPSRSPGTRRAQQGLKARLEPKVTRVTQEPPELQAPGAAWGVSKPAVLLRCLHGRD